MPKRNGLGIELLADPTRRQIIAVLALVVVNALKQSPWGIVTIGLTIPIAMLMGIFILMTYFVWFNR